MLQLGCIRYFLGSTSGRSHMLCHFSALPKHTDDGLLQVAVRHNVLDNLSDMADKEKPSVNKYNAFCINHINYSSLKNAHSQSTPAYSIAVSKIKHADSIADLSKCNMHETSEYEY